MATEIGDAIRYGGGKNISEELVISTIEDILKAAYKRTGTDENAVIEFSDDYQSVELFSRRKIVDDDEWYNEITEIPLSDAVKIHEDGEIGDELLISVDLKEFDRISVQSAKQRAHQSFRDIQKDTLYSEYKTKEGQLIIGYFRRQVPNGDIYVDIGSTEGLLPRRNQSSRESYGPNDKIKCYVELVEKAERGLASSSPAQAPNSSAASSSRVRRSPRTRSTSSRSSVRPGTAPRSPLPAGMTTSTRSGRVSA